MNYNICIDFGTCNTVISYFQDNNLLQIIDDYSGDVLIPTTLFFIKENLVNKINLSDIEYGIDYYIGYNANEHFFSNKESTNYFYQFKRFLGITNKSIESQKEFLNKYNIEYSVDDDLIYFNLQHNDNIISKISIVDLIKFFFKGLYNILSKKLNLNEKIPIIITCPAYFHDLQRSQLKRAVESSGFEIFKICNEPTTAAIYYIYRINKNNENQKYIVYDLGGGTIDTTVVEYYSLENTCEVIDIDGNNCLGGVDLDNILFYDIYKKYLIDINNKKWVIKIKKYAEEIKIKLTNNLNVDIYLENVPININNNIEFKDLKISYSRHNFNVLINSIIDEMIEPIKKMYNKHNISNIIFIGGPTQIPLLKTKISSIINQDLTFLENFQSLYKTIVSQGGSIFYKKLEKKENFCLLEIVPMNIGISDADNNMIIMIEKNSKIPVQTEKTFTTTYDCQRSISIDVYEGINNNCLENSYIGSYKILGIPPLPKNMIIIKLKFIINYNGILNITINGCKNYNQDDDTTSSKDFKLENNIKLISNLVAKELIKKLLINKK